MDIVALVNKYGFPIIAAAGMGYFIYFVWKWVTTVIKPVIGQANGTLIALIDRIRMLDNDLIRLNQKVETVMELRGKTIEYERIKAEQEINKAAEEPQPTKKHKKQEIKDSNVND
jgi:tetrahydromethanopterin S-methyltransferase subunit E